MKWLKSNLFECGYREKCSGYRDESYTCNEALNKRYCGTYKEFEGMIVQ